MKSSLMTLLALGTLITCDRCHAIDPDLGRFITSKERQIRNLSEGITNKVPSFVWSFFDAVRVDDWETASNLTGRIKSSSGRYFGTGNGSKLAALNTLIWPPISESWGAYGEFRDWNNRWLHRFGREIIRSVPRNSIYFGGTDPGRFVISALCDSQVDARPFFVLTQNQLVDGPYLEYLRAMYGKRLRIPTDDDSRQAFNQYTTNALARFEHDRRFPDEPRQVKPGEHVSVGENGRVRVGGEVSVMAINGLLVKQIFEDNPGHEFFVEESFPLDWMYPYLEPHGLIFKLSRHPLAEIPAKQMAEDQSYWKRLSGEMLGGWLVETTSVRQVCDFVDKYGLGKHLDDYRGDKDFARNENARATFSKLRSSIAGLYAWRSEHARDTDERDRMYRAADLAFRQSYAMCPVSPEAIWRYVNLLVNRRRVDDAILIVKTSLHLEPDDQALKGLLSQLMRYR